VLKRFRTGAPNVQRCLWIDAICLNQKGAIEKAHQVSTMGQIYDKARGVYIWLGLEEKDTAGIFEFLHDVVYIPSLGSPLLGETTTESRGEASLERLKSLCRIRFAAMVFPPLDCPRSLAYSPG
jgi:hypothetical protein